MKKINTTTTRTSSRGGSITYIISRLSKIFMGIGIMFVLIALGFVFAQIVSENTFYDEITYCGHTGFALLLGGFIANVWTSPRFDEKAAPKRTRFLN